jgi:Flp pilus assembly protein TadB
VSARSRERARTTRVIDDLNAIVDQLRSGASLRQAFTRIAQGDGSPFHPVASALSAGRPLAHALRDEATLAVTTRGTSGGEADLAGVYCVLAVHAQAGGDPTLACRSLAERLGRRFAAREEARALTTQSRLGARAILLLTPAFLLLVSVSDPRGIASYVGEPRSRSALIAGLLLQALGAVWIARIVAAIGSSSSGGRVPIVRAVRALLVGKTRPPTDEDCAQTAETVAFALDAGLSPTAALREVAPFAPGDFGDAVRKAANAVGVPIHEALAGAVEGLEGDAPSRFARAFAWSAELGVPLAEALCAVADDVRGAMSIRFTEDVRRASMRVLLPLGVLVLPAFVLACLVPLFVGGLSGIAS